MSMRKSASIKYSQKIDYVLVRQIPKKGSAKECSNYRTIALISRASKVMLKILLRFYLCSIEDSLLLTSLCVSVKSYQPLNIFCLSFLSLTFFQRDLHQAGD